MARHAHLLLVASCPIFLWGCGRSAPDRAVQEQALWVGHVPVYPGVDLALVIGADRPGRNTTIWRFRTTEDPEKLVAYYQRMLPGAQRSPEDDGIVSFTYQPGGTGDGETVIVHVWRGELRITGEAGDDAPGRSF